MNQSIWILYCLVGRCSSLETWNRECSTVGPAGLLSGIQHLYGVLLGCLAVHGLEDISLQLFQSFCHGSEGITEGLLFSIVAFGIWGPA